MPILLALVAAVGALLFWQIFLKNPSQPNGSARSNGQNAPSQGPVSSEIVAPIALINDPISATATFLIALADTENQLDAQAETFIKSEITKVMGITKVDELYDFARHAASQVTDPSNLMIRFARIWVSDLSESERRDVYDMAQKVVNLRGAPTDLQAVCLKQLAVRLAITTA